MSSERRYNSNQAASLFGVTAETVRAWGDEFHTYLSPTASPGKKRTRLFTTEDMQVLSLVAEYKRDNLSFADIHAALQNGQRGSAPDLPPDEIQAIVYNEQEKRLTQQVEQLQRALTRLQEEHAQALTQLEQARQYEIENARLQSKVEAQQSQLEEAKQRVMELAAQLQEAQKRLQELSEESGKSYAKGVMDALRNRGDLSSD